MSFLGNIINRFTSSDDPDKDTNWNIIGSKEEMESIISLSKERIQLVFKHSPNCGVSFFAMRSLNTPEIINNQDIDLNLIDVIGHRNISKLFAEKTGIRHESPQVFLLKNAEVIWYDSHNAVNAKNVMSNLDQ